MNQCWRNAGPSSATLAQHYTSIGSSSSASVSAEGGVGK